MHRVRKTILVVLASLSVFLILLLATALLVPTFMDLPKLRGHITAQLSQQLNGRVTCDAMRLSIVPLPAAVLTGVTVSIAGTVDATIASVSVYPRLVSLLRGKVEPGKIRLQAPHITVPRVLLKPGQAASKSDSTDAYRSIVQSTLAAVSSLAASAVAGAVAVVEDGSVDLTVGSGAAVRFEHVEARVALPPDRLAVAMNCVSNVWDRLSVSASIDPSNGEGVGRMEMVRLRPQAIGAQLLPHGLQLGDSELNLAIDVSTHGVDALHVQLDGSFPALTVRRGDEQVVMRSQRLRATLERHRDATQVLITALQLEYPHAQLSGGLSMTPNAVTLEVAAADVDVDSVRHVGTVVAGKLPIVQAVFDVLHGGSVPQITVHSQAPSLAALGADEALRINGRLVGGRVHVPGMDLDFDGVTGEVALVNGILVGEQVSGLLGKSRATEGTVRVGLGRARPDLHVHALVEADAAETAALLKRLVTNEAFRREFERFSDITGTISGTLLLEGTTADVAVTANASAFSVSTRVEGLPSPLQIEGGEFIYATTGVEARDVTLASGGSRLSEVAFRISPSFEAAAGRSEVILGELYPWLHRSGWLPQSAWNPAALRGTLSLKSLRLGWDPDVRRGWQFELTGSAQKLVIESAQAQQRVATQYPVSLSDLHVRHDTATGTSFAAKVVAPDNLSGAVDVVWNGERLDINELSVHDGHSDASLALFLGPRDLSLRFKGELTKATLDRLIENDLLAESVRGDIRARVQRDQLARAVVQGRLEAHEVAVPLRNGRHLRIESVALNGAGDSVSGNAIVDTPEGIHMQVRGVVKQSPQALMADIDVVTGRIDWSAIEPWLSDSDDVVGAATSNVGPRQLRGKARVAAEAFSYGGFTWQPVRAVVTLAPGGLTVTVNDAKVCGVATPGTIAVKPQGLNLAFKPVAKNQQLQVLGDCLRLGNEPDTGQYSLDAEITVHGAAAQLARSMQGRVRFHASKGRLYGMGMTARALSLLSVATGAVGNISNLTKEGLPYDAIDVEGDVRNGVLVLRQATLKGPSVNWAAEGSADVPARTLSLILLVAPLTTVDTLVSRLPVISGILGGSVVAIPVRVSGSFEAPDITPLPPSAVGKGLLGVMTRALKTPMRLVQPLLPD